jgi:acyl carrier protein
MLTKDKILQIISKELKLDAAKVNPEANFIKDLGISSMTLWEMVLVLEDAFGLEVSDDEMKKLRTIKAVVDYIEGKVGKDLPE